MIFDNLEIEFRGAGAGPDQELGGVVYQTTDAQITVDGVTRSVGTVFYSNETGEGFIQLDPYDSQTDTGITTAEIQSGALLNLEFGYTVWDWTAPLDVTVNPMGDKAFLSAELTNVVESADYNIFELQSSITFETDETLTIKIAPEGNGFNFAEFADDFYVPLEYSTDGGQTWQQMAAPTTYFAPGYAPPLPVFEFVLPAGADSVLIRIEIFDDLKDEDPAGSIDPASGQGIEVIDLTIEGDSSKFYQGNFENGFPPAPTFQPGIIDNDPSTPAPYIDIDFVQVYEHDGNAVFTVTLFDADGNVAIADSDVTFNYFSTDLSAQAGLDYQAVAGSATIVAGSSSVTLSVPIIDDQFIEPTELAVMTVGDVSGQLGGIDVVNNDPQGSLRIIDNDQGVFSVSDVTVVEGTVVPGEGAGVLVTVTRFGAGPEQGNQTVTISTLPISGSDTAQAADFTAISDVVLTFAPGVTTQTVFIPITDDQLIEAPETFRVELSNPTDGAIIAEPGLAADDGVGVVTVIDNDSASIVIADAETEEGSSAVFAVTITKASTEPVDITFTAAVLAGNTAEATDFDASNLVVTYDNSGQPAIISQNVDGSYTVPAGVVELSVAVPTIDDDVYEGEETFTLSAATDNAEYDTTDTGTGSIFDDGSKPDGDDPDDESDDDRPVFGINDVAVDEDAGTIVFTVTLVGDSELPANVSYNVSEGSATEPQDYSAGLNGLSGTLTFAPGVTTQTITLNVTDDALKELPETFTVDLSNPINAIIGDGQGIGTITDEDDPDSEDTITLSVIAVDAGGDEIGASEAAEGEALYYKVIAVDSLGATVSGLDGTAVDVVFNNLTAASTDYTPSATTVAIGSVFSAALIDDYSLEGAETYTVGLVPNAGFDAAQSVYEKVEIGTSLVTSTILDGSDEPDGGDDPADTVYAVISVDDASIEEGEQAVFTVSLQDKDGNAVTATSDIDVTLEWTGAAANAGDAAPLPTTVTVTNGSTTATVIAVDDYFKETPEDLIATITGLVDQDDPDAFENLAIGDVNGNNASATTEITDEDNPGSDDTISLSISGPDTVVEGDLTTDYTVALKDENGVLSQHKKMWSLRLRTPARRRMDRTYTSQQDVTILQGATNATLQFTNDTETRWEPDETIILDNQHDE